MRATAIAIAAVAAGALSTMSAPLVLANDKWDAKAQAMTLAPPPPPPVGKCKTDEALRQQCTTMWNSCVAAKHGAAQVCKYDWHACCTDKPVRRF